MTTPLPVYIKTGLVLGRSIVIDVDTLADPDAAPDAFFPVGSALNFTPSVDTLVFTSEHDTCYVDVVAAVVGGDGNPTTPDGAPLYLVANVGQPENDQAWYWTCKPTIDGKTRSAFRVDVPADGAVYLTDQQPIPSTPAGSTVTRGEPGVSAPPFGTSDGAVAVSQGGTVTWGTGAGIQSAVAAMADRALSFISGQMRDLAVPTSQSVITPDVIWPSNYIGPVTGGYSVVLGAAEPTAPCPVTIANPVGALPDSFRGTVFGGLAIPSRAGLEVQAYKLTDTFYPFVAPQPCDPSSGTWGVDLSGVAPDQKGAWYFGLLDTKAGNAQVGEKWPSADAYPDIEVDQVVVTDAVYPVLSQTANVAGRFSFTRTDPGRKGYRLTRRSTGEVLAASLPLTGNVRSYLVAPGEPGYGTRFVNQCYAYDQAMALLAAIARGRRDLADPLVQGLLLLQTSGGASDGGFIFSGLQLAPAYGDPAYRTGAHAICTEALLAYIQAYCTGEFLSDGSAGPTSQVAKLTAAARRALAYLATMLSTSTMTAGLYTGGSGTYDSTDSGKFDPTEDLTWASTEHNLDSYHCLVRAAAVLGDASFTAAAATLAANIHAMLWDPANGRFLQGMKTDQPDPADPLDCHTWAAIFCAETGRLDRAQAILDPAVLAPYRYELHGAAGYAPIRPGDPQYPGAAPTIWPEGTLSAALAFLAIGDAARWYTTITDLMPVQRPDGSYPYVTDQVAAYDWTPSKGVTGCAWAVLAAAGHGVWGVELPAGD